MVKMLLLDHKLNMMDQLNESDEISDEIEVLENLTEEK